MWWKQTDTFFPCEKIGTTNVEQLKPVQTKNRVCNVESIVCAIYKKFWLQTRVLVCGLPSSEGETVAPVENRAASDQLAKNKFQNHIWRETLKDLRITLVSSCTQGPSLLPGQNPMQVVYGTKHWYSMWAWHTRRHREGGTSISISNSCVLVEFCPSGCLAMMYFPHGHVEQAKNGHITSNHPHTWHLFSIRDDPWLCHNVGIFPSISAKHTPKQHWKTLGWGCQPVWLHVEY